MYHTSDRLCYLQIQTKKNLVLILLLDAKVALGYLKRRMIIDNHQDGRTDTGNPGMITEGFSERMTAYIIGQMKL